MDVETYVRDQILRDGEEIVWRGRPDPALALKRALPRSAFGIVFLLFATFWTLGAADTDGGLGLAILGLPFIGIGAWLSSAPIKRYARAKTMYYGVTDQRALIIELGKNTHAVSIEADEINDVLPVYRDDGSGDLRLRRAVVIRDQQPRRHHRRKKRHDAASEDGFWGTDDIAGAVEAIGHLTKGQRAEHEA